MVNMNVMWSYLLLITAGSKSILGNGCSHPSCSSPLSEVHHRLVSSDCYKTCLI